MLSLYRSLNKVPKRRSLLTVIITLFVCIIQQDMKYRVPMCMLRMLDINPYPTNVVYIWSSL
jgi:hypothetical protein